MILLGSLRANGPCTIYFPLQTRKNRAKSPAAEGPKGRYLKRQPNSKKHIFLLAFTGFETSEISASTTIQWSGIQIYTVGSVDYLVSVSGKMLLLNFLSVIFHCC